MLAEPEQRRTRARLLVEPAVRAMVSGNGFEEIVLAVRPDVLDVLLRLDFAAGQIAIEDGGHKLVAEDGLVRRRAHDPLLPARMGGLPDRPGRDFGLVDGTDRLRLPARVRANPVELRRVHARQLHHRVPHLAAFRKQFDPDELTKPCTACFDAQ